MKPFVIVTYFVHGTTTDNEKGVATGWEQGELSPVGVKQCEELRDAIQRREFDMLFTSDLKRAEQSAEIVFEGRGPIVVDPRLRECNYGDMNGADSSLVRVLDEKCIDNPFPEGESFRDVEDRMRLFLQDLLKECPGRKVAVMSHRAPQLALEVIVNGRSWKQAFREDWRSKKPSAWKPGWDYRFEG